MKISLKKSIVTIGHMYSNFCIILFDASPFHSGIISTTLISLKFNYITQSAFAFYYFLTCKLFMYEFKII